MSNAFIFPGQGSQSLGMLAELAEKYGQLVTDPFTDASEELGGPGDYRDRLAAALSH